MAADTKEKRLSLLNFGLPWWSTLPEADGAINADNRLHLLHLYSGVSPSGARGLDFTLGANRLHFTLDGNLPHFTLHANRTHFVLPEED